MVVAESIVQDNGRKRKAHNKSRQGCGNCKLRRVKCDELKPNCKKCVAFGVSCDYEDDSSPDLQFNGMGAFRVDIATEEKPNPMQELIDSMLNAPLLLHVDGDSPADGNVCYLEERHLELLQRFQTRAVRTLGTADTIELYSTSMITMASTHAYLLHAILRFTMLHDRYADGPLGASASTEEIFHAFHSVAMFSQTLANPILEHDKDPLWATAAVLGATSFALTDATCAAEAWPLKASNGDDLDWLKMSEGKREVFRLVNPLRVGSVFRELLIAQQNQRNDQPTRPVDPDLDRLFPYVTRLYNLGSPRSEDEQKDPYYTAASILERLIPLTASHATIMWFLSFLGHMEVEFRELLIVKDPQALLLLSWWYAKLIPYGTWWLYRRSLFECQAICMYLDRELPPGHEIRRLLEFPRWACGLQPKPSETKMQVCGIPAVATNDWQWQRNF